MNLISDRRNNFNWIISNIIHKNLCCGCGTCVGVCPTEAIKLDCNYYPEWLNAEACINCSFCTKACPGGGMDLDKVTKDLRLENQNYIKDIGNYKRFLIGHSKDDYIRRRSASGGLATSLLIYSLNKRIVDRVIVVTNDNINIFKPLAKSTNSEEVVLEAAQSKYIQVPLNKAIKEIINCDLRYGLIGLPCHLHGLYLSQRLHNLLSKRVVLKIGLFCGYSYSYECINALLKMLKINYRDIDRFQGWREGENYPGSFSIILKNGEVKSLSFVDEHSIDVANFALFRCFLCIDGLNQLADISIGDSTDTNQKDSFAISRTNLGDSLLESAKNDGVISFRELDTKSAMEKSIMPFMIREKRYKVTSVISYLSSKGITTPIWDIKEGNIARIDKINAILRIRMIMFIRQDKIRPILESYPKIMQNVGGFIYHLDMNPKHLILKIFLKILERWPKGLIAARHLYHFNSRSHLTKMRKFPRTSWHGSKK